MAGGIGASFTYFSMGTVQLTDDSGQAIQDCRPNEWSLDVSYYRKLHEYVSMAVALRFMYSDLNNGINSSTSGSSQEMKAAWTMAADVDLYYRQPIDIPMGTSYFALGFTLTNLGGKMSYYDYMPFRSSANFEIPIPLHFTLEGVNANTQIWNITRLDSIYRMPVELNGTTLSFYGSNMEEVQEYVAVNVNGSHWQEAKLIGNVSNQDLHALQDIDFVIITPAEFIDYAKQLADAHEQKDHITTAVVTDQQVYNEFVTARE